VHSCSCITALWHPILGGQTRWQTIKIRKRVRRVIYNIVKHLGITPTRMLHVTIICAMQEIFQRYKNLKTKLCNCNANMYLVSVCIHVLVQYPIVEAEISRQIIQPSQNNELCVNENIDKLLSVTPTEMLSTKIIWNWHFACSSLIIHVCYKLHLTRPPWLDLPNNVWWTQSRSSMCNLLKSPVT
jgi:hypothetical protein